MPGYVVLHVQTNQELSPKCVLSQAADAVEDKPSYKQRKQVTLLHRKITEKT